MTMSVDPEDRWQCGRNRMVRTLEGYKIADSRVLQAMSRVPRHAFIPQAFRMQTDPYGDHPCPIGHAQTISQPYIVAYMIERAALRPGMRVLEIGAGSGYLAAVLAEMGVEVFSVEIIASLVAHARSVLDALGYQTVRVLQGNGYSGCPEHAPYDAIIVSCAPATLPKELLSQLKNGGRMVLPVGVGIQDLVCLRKMGETVERETAMSVRFVPLVGEEDV